MRNHTLLILFTLFFLTNCTTNSRKSNCNTYSEATLQVTVTSDWDEIKNGLHSSIGSSNIRYTKHEIPEIEESYEWENTAWKGERLSSQLVLWSKDSISDIHIDFSDFISTSGSDKISSQIISTNFVRYVITDEFGNACGERSPNDFAASLSADVLDNVQCINMSPRTTQPVWVNINIPNNTTAGVYSSKAKLKSGNKVISEFTFKIEVLNQTLPAPSEWSFHLDLWQNPYAVARVANTEPWSPEHWNELRPLMKILADAGQKVITTTINKRPWNGQTEDAYDSMIGWTRKKNGTWTYDYTHFDNWVEFMMGIGVKSQINCYSMVPWGNYIYYFDEREDKEVKLAVQPGTKEYEAIWKPFLIDFTAHLSQKGWEHITMIAMDERNPEEMKAMIKLLNETSPSLGVSIADNHKSYKQFPDMLKDLCVEQRAIVDKSDLQYRRSKGYKTTWYVCCSHVFPNVFTFSEPAEGAFIGWYTRAADFDGFLRWAYNSWVKEPLLDSRFRTWPAGDTYIVYPGGRSSIRFEKLREGIQDAEKIRILRDKFQNDNSGESKKRLKQLEELVNKFNLTMSPPDLIGLLDEGKKGLEKLSR